MISELNKQRIYFVLQHQTFHRMKDNPFWVQEMFTANATYLVINQWECKYVVCKILHAPEY
jgi:lauroyl/myristoyl acyltransferase